MVGIMLEKKERRGREDTLKANLSMIELFFDRSVFCEHNLMLSIHIIKKKKKERKGEKRNLRGDMEVDENSKEIRVGVW